MIYNYTRKYLTKFIDESVVIDTNINSFEISHIESFSRKNLIWSVVQYVNENPNNDNEKYQVSKTQHYERIRACHDIFKTLESESIPYAVIKGAYLDKIAYKNMGLRSAGDIDLLIDKKNYRKLNELLYLNGFVCGEWNYKEQRAIEYSRETILYNYLYTHQSAPYIKISTENQIINLDLNFSVSWGEDISGVTLTEQILKESQIIRYEGFNYRVLNPEMFLLQLCLHSYRDMNSIILLSNGSYTLRLLCDICYYIVHANMINSDKFIKLCIQYHFEKYVYYVFHYTTEVFGYIAWVDYVKNLIRPNDLDYLNTFGLSADEIKIWNISFQERVSCENLYEVIKPLLTDADIKKIESIKNNM